MKIDRKIEAFWAADRLINMIESAGMSITDPDSIRCGDYQIIPDQMQWRCGATRMVVWDEECDYVIKIALDEKFEKYNKHEVEVYEAAVKNGLADEFAWCACYVEPCEDDDLYVPGVYVMEYLEGDYDLVSDEAMEYGYNVFCEANGYEKNHESLDEYYNYREDEENELMDYFVAEWDTDKIYDFNTFLCDYNINDLHGGNMLFRGNKLVLCDYAGYGW